MEIKALQYYLAVVREGNISRAAEVLHVTQPALSRQIAQLEEELGTQLFIRGRRLKLTNAGIMLQRRAEEVTALVEKIEDDFADAKEIGGVISIGSGGLYSSRVFPEIMANFRKDHPNVSYRLYTNSAEYVKQQLEQGLLDFGLLLEPVDVTKFDYVRMKDKERWGLLLRRSHPLAKKEFITREDLWNETLITSDRLPVQKELLTWIGRPKAELDIFCTFNLITQAVDIVDAGLASALTIEGAVNMYPTDRLVFRPLKPELYMSSVFAWKKPLPEFGAAAAFLNYFKSML
ncbi:LysR family transcriptional regulator [Lactobacillus sp.]|uniref:LysR family transcriptional regulator n=1 Tax=Lactobacillus sp. TaxID=1591 RepID=UPI003F0C7B3C